MIYLNPEILSALGDDTFWMWFKREFLGSSFDIPEFLNSDDVILQYSTLGFANRAGKSIALLWELYPEMKMQLKSNEWDARIEKTFECAKFSTYRVASTRFTVPFYEQFGRVDILPIGVDTDLFKPIDEKKNLRKKYNIPREKTVGVWCGTTHRMKGFDRLKEYAEKHPEIYWIIIWKTPAEAGHLPGAKEYVQVTQPVLSELLNCADFYLSCSLLRPFYMVEWEAMACNLEMRILGDIEKDFVPSSNPRNDVFAHGWDRKTTKKLWSEYLKRKGISW
ncbi:MAG: hypothetical protein QXT63_00785 [Thermoplasmata archaeon]